MVRAKRSVRRWQDRDHFRTHVSVWSERIRVSPSRVLIRPMRHKWGSCSKSGTLTFSSDLLDQNIEFGEFVIVHELLHLKIPNHGKLFTGLLGSVSPRVEKDRRTRQSARR